MLQKEFFQVQPVNPNPYWDPVIVNLSGAQKFEEDTVFMPGKYRIELAPGKDWFAYLYPGGLYGYMVNMDFITTVTEKFIIRAYCGSSALDKTIPGTNLYSGPFKVNAVNANDFSQATTPQPAGISVNHIFGAGGGNGRTTPSFPVNAFAKSGGANCLGNGNLTTWAAMDSGYQTSGAGSCLHFLPVGGTFGINYIRAYHAAPIGGAGSVYGGAGVALTGIGESGWFSNGGNSPYGTGATSLSGSGSGVGAGGIRTNNVICAAGAYFNGTQWVDCHGTVPVTDTNDVPASYIRVTYLGPVGS